MFKLHLSILKCIYTEIGDFPPLGIYTHFSTNMYINNFELQQLCEKISGLVIFFKIIVDNEQHFENYRISIAIR